MDAKGVADPRLYLDDGKNRSLEIFIFLFRRILSWLILLLLFYIFFSLQNVLDLTTVFTHVVGK